MILNSEVFSYLGKTIPLLISSGGSVRHIYPYKSLNNKKFV